VFLKRISTINHFVMSALLSAAAVWSMPAHGADAPLPEAKIVLQRVLERSQKDAENDRLFEQRYNYTRTETTEYRNGKGALKKTESKETQHHAGETVAADAKHPPGKPDADSGQKHGSVKAKRDDKPPGELDDELVKRFQIEVAARENLDGRPVLKLVFTPAPNAPSGHSIVDRFINRIAGQAWVDEHDYALVKFAFHLTAPVNVLGGLAGTVRALNFQFDRSRTADGLWFTRQTSFHMEAREVLFNHILDSREETSAITPKS
jgi:hypothetical protein